MKRIFRKEFIIGLCVIIAGIMLFVGMNYLKGINIFNPSNFYYAYYDNVEGLAVSSPVSINGYKVGTVREITFNYDKPGKVKVLLALDTDLKVPENSHAKIAQTLLSGAYIDLSLGDSHKMLAKGDEIASGVDADLMSALTAHIMPAITDILPKIDSLMVNLNEITGNPALTSSINRLDDITKNVDHLTGSLDKTVTRSVPAVMNNAQIATARLDSISQNLADLSYTLKQLPLASTMDNVEKVTDNLSIFSQKLNNNNSTLGKLMNDPSLYNQLNQVGADVDSLIVDIKKNPKRYISIKLL